MPKSHNQASNKTQPAFNPQAFLATASTQPGVYQMLDAKGAVLYVGKARNLKKRLASYFRKTVSDAKTEVLVAQIHDIHTTITASENEALLVENDLIKELSPRYNILLRDDKSYPYLFFSTQAEFPRLDLHRGSRAKKGRYFGPYPNVGSVRETLTLLQKLFKLRQCNDAFFNNRTRPCLQYQIKRCTAPCVNYINHADYQANVNLAILFLEGKNQEIIDDITQKMAQASNSQQYEQAVIFRDLVVSLRRVQQQTNLGNQHGDIDVVAVAARHGVITIQVMQIRAGRLIGDRAYFPKVPKNTDTDEALAAFLPQYYLSRARGGSIPREIFLNIHLADQDWIEKALMDSLKCKINFSTQVRGQRLKWLKMAVSNAENALSAHLSSKMNFYARIEALQKVLQLTNLPQRIECFDVSHTAGEATVASCVVFGAEGPVNQDYRRFNIEGVTPGDDYAAMSQALNRRYLRIKKGEGALPDVLIIDGGKGQLKIAETVLEELQISGVTILGIVKGPGRKPVYDRVIKSGSSVSVTLAHDSPALHLIQHIRDEAHRVAITAHRKRRAKARTQSVLDDIEGIGPKRRKALLHHFGGLQELKRASVDDMVKVPGVSRGLAEKIFARLR